MIKSIIIASFLLSSRLLALSHTIECKLEFAHDSYEFDQSRLDVCFPTENEKPSYITVFATATPTGSGMYNLALSRKRALEVSKYLEKRFPETAIEQEGGGINPQYGRSAKIIAVLTEKEATTVPSGHTKHGLGLSILGGAHKMNASIYQSIGGEFTYSHLPVYGLFVGIRAQNHAHDEFLNLNTAYLNTGLNIEKGSYQFAILGLIGGVFSAEDQKLDFGAEAKFGFSTHGKDISYFLAIGRTLQFEAQGSLVLGLIL